MQISSTQYASIIRHTVNGGISCLFVARKSLPHTHTRRCLEKDKIAVDEKKKSERRTKGNQPYNISPY